MASGPPGEHIFASPLWLSQDILSMRHRLATAPRSDTFDAKNMRGHPGSRGAARCPSAEHLRNYRASTLP